MQEKLLQPKGFIYTQKSKLNGAKQYRKAGITIHPQLLLVFGETQDKYY